MHNSNKNKEEPDSTVKRVINSIVNRFKGKTVTLEQSVNELIKEHDLQDTIDIEEKEMLENFIDFRDLKANEVMVPRTFIVGIHNNATFAELKEKFISAGHTRLPVYKDNLDEIIGFVHMKDFIPFIGKEHEFTLNKLIRDLIYVPRSVMISDLLIKMRHSGIHIAIILDEYGGTDGLITIENLVEEIVGDIKDEHYKGEEQELVKVEGETITIDSKALVEDIEEKFNVDLKTDSDDFETFGGLILAHLGRVPVMGEKFDHPSGLEIEIADADERRIKSVKINLKDEI